MQGGFTRTVVEIVPKVGAGATPLGVSESLRSKA